MASATVFICYRRDDSAGYAGRLFDRLVAALGRTHVFRDVDDIQPGSDFTDAIRGKIRTADVMLVLIGPRWLTASSADGQRRLDDPNDLVRVEIQTALERNMRVIPVLLPGAVMPGVQDLPLSLAPLAQRHAFEVRDVSFDRDVLHLVGETRGSRPGIFQRRLGVRPLQVAAVAAVVALAGVASIYWLNPMLLTTPQQAREQIARAGLAFDGESLVKSARNGDTTAVSLFLRAGMNPDEASGNDTAFEAALENKHMAIVTQLIDGGADVSRALSAVARTGDLELVRLLLAKKPDRDGLRSALYQAISSKHLAVVRQLLEAGADVNDNANSTALATAAYYGDPEIVKLLLARGADVNAAEGKQCCDNKTALHNAARSGVESTDVMTLLLKAGASVNAADEDGRTPLMDSVSQREKVLVLLEAGADVNARDERGETALIYAAKNHLPEIVRILVSKGAAIDAQGEEGLTALMGTSGAIDGVDHPQTVQALLESGADVDLQDRTGRTALMHAAQRALDATVRLLIASGADRNKKTKGGETALMLARRTREQFGDSVPDRVNRMISLLAARQP